MSNPDTGGDGATGALPFAAPVRAWFAATLGAPTPIQAAAFPLIAAGRSALLIAPTGSGKTLAAFLAALDRLGASPRTPGTRVVYISPLRALATDIEKNLRRPLDGIGLGFRRPAVDLRTSDTPQSDRRRQARAPAEVLVTTPESLYILLGSKARAHFAGVDTVIVDEIHTLLGTKRGAHLALSLERLANIAGPFQRIGLSATLRPPEAAADFLRGSGPPVDIVDASGAPRLEFAIEFPSAGASPTTTPTPTTTPAPTPVLRAASAPEPIASAATPAPTSLASSPPTPPPAGGLPGPPPHVAAHGPLPRAEVDHGLTGMGYGAFQSGLPRSGAWPALVDRTLDVIAAHRTTLVFVPARSACERLARRLCERARERGLAEPLPHGPPFVEAHHGSLAQPRRKAVEDALKEGRLRGLVATSSLELGIDVGSIDIVVQIGSPGSVSSALQRFGRSGHSVSEVSRGLLLARHRGELPELIAIGRALASADVEPIAMPRAPLDVLAQQVIASVATGTQAPDALFALATRAAPFRDLSRRAFDAVIDMLCGASGSPDFSEVPARLTRDADGSLRTRPGVAPLTLQNAGTIPDRGLYAVVIDGTTHRVGELDEEMVHESKPGETVVLGMSTWRIARIADNVVHVLPAPGEPGRLPFWKGDATGRSVFLGERIGAVWDELQRDEPLGDSFLTGPARDAVRALAAEQSSQSALPSARRVVIEETVDRGGDRRITILSPLGLRVHAPWALAIDAELVRRGIVASPALADDDGIVLRFAGAAPVDLAALIPDPASVRDVLITRLPDTSLFAGRFREAAARALLLPRQRFGERIPLWSQRLRARDMLRAAERTPEFPVRAEAMRECLADVFDLPSLTRLLSDREAGGIERIEVEHPSPLAAALAVNFVAEHLYDGDVPAEGRALALSLDRHLLASLLGAEAWRDLIDEGLIRSLEESLQGLPPSEPIRGGRSDPEDDGVQPGERANASRATDRLLDRLRRLGDLTEAEAMARGFDIGQLEALARSGNAVTVTVAGETRWVATADAPVYAAAFADREGDADALPSLLRRYARHHAPFPAAAPARRFGLPAGVVAPLLDRMAEAGSLLRGPYDPAVAGDVYCDPSVWEQLRRRAEARTRKDTEPVDAATLARFLLGLHGMPGGATLDDAARRLDGCPLWFEELEGRLLPARVRGFRPAALDALTASGEWVWVGLGRNGDSMRIALRRRRDACAPRGAAARPGDGEHSALSERLLDRLRERGATFLAELVADAHVAPSDVFVALIDLAAQGLVTNDTFEPLRALPRRGAARFGGGRWSALPSSTASPEATALAAAEALLLRYGFVSPSVVEAEQSPWSPVRDALDAMEDGGRVLRGAVLPGEHGVGWVARDALTRLRATRETRGGTVVIAACDPANPYGVAVPWPGDGRRAAGDTVLLDNGEPIFLAMAGGALRMLRGADDREALARALIAWKRTGPVRVRTIDGRPARSSSFAGALRTAGFREDLTGFE